MGLSMLLGPAVGGWMAERSFRACYALSALFGMLSALSYTFGFKETLRRDPAKGDGKALAWIDWTAVNPLSFMKLFRGSRTLAWLTMVSTISELCDGTSEVDRHYGIQIANMSLTQDGMHNSLRGLSSVAGGRLVQPVIRVLPNRRYTTLCTGLALAHFLTKAFARNPAVYMAALIPYVLGAGTYRSAVINAQLVKYALEAGLKEGETAACQANFKALLGMATPWLYSALYAKFSESNAPGAPYLMCSGFLLVSHLASCMLSAKEMGDE